MRADHEHVHSAPYEDTRSVSSSSALRTVHPQTNHQRSALVRALTSRLAHGRGCVVRLYRTCMEGAHVSAAAKAAAKMGSPVASAAWRPSPPYADSSRPVEGSNAP